MLSSLKSRAAILLLFMFANAAVLTGTAVAAPPEPVFQNNVFHFSKGEPKSVVIAAGTQPFIVAALAFEGVIVLGADGKVVDHLYLDNPLSEATAVSVSPIMPVNSRSLILLAIADEGTSSVLLRGMDPQTGHFTNDIRHSTVTDTIPTHLCIAQDIHDRSLYLYTGGEHGMLAQYRIVMPTAGEISLAWIRNIAIGGETSSCIADNRSGIVYVVEPEVGLWTVQVDPETDAIRRMAAVNTPFGPLQEPVAVALISHKQQISPLVVDQGIEALVRLSSEGKPSARLRLASMSGKGGINGDIEGMATGRFPISGKIQDILAVAVQGESGGGSLHLLPTGTLGTWPDIKDADTNGHTVVVTPVVETDVAPSTGDAADDPAIWIHPQDPADSLVLGTDKNGGLMVMDLAGKLIQFLPDGRLNNVDVRSGFSDIPGLNHIAAATNRTDSAINLYAINPVTRQVSRVDARSIPAEFYDPYGLCLYHSRRSGEFYVIATSGDGKLHQWRLFSTVDGKIDAELVRRLNIGTVAEGCVADDETGLLYVGEEDVGIWRYPAEPAAGNDRVLVDGIHPDGQLIDDVEGLAIYRMTGDRGYIVASSQGSDSYVVYDRNPPHAHRGTFRIRANVSTGIDGVSETDGLDVSSTALPGYAQGILIVQDGRNIEPAENQNFKFISWQAISSALGLEQ